MEKEVRVLSGGERSRLELAILGLLPANILLLDEPTNHLDVDACESLERFLLDGERTLLLVSHDRRLLERVCTKLWVVDEGLAVPFDGGWREWRRAIVEGWSPAAADAAVAARTGFTVSKPVGGARAIASNRARTGSTLSFIPRPSVACSVARSRPRTPAAPASRRPSTPR